MRRGQPGLQGLVMAAIVTLKIHMVSRRCHHLLLHIYIGQLGNNWWDPKIIILSLDCKHRMLRDAGLDA